MNRDSHGVGSVAPVGANVPSLSEWWVGAALARNIGDDRPAHTYLRGDGSAVELTRVGLHDEVTCRAAALRAWGVRAADRVALVAADAESFVPTFLALLWLGAVPVPLAPPPALSRRDGWRSAVDEALAVARPTLVCGPAHALDGLAPPVLPVEELAGPGAAWGAERTADGPVELAPGAPGYLQFTSGSTGRPRAVVVSRANLAANCAAIAAGLGLDGQADVGVCWLPLHHDMGLVGFVCAALTAGVPVVFVPTSAFVRDPGVWMRTVSAYRGTVTFGPTFAFALAARRVDAATLSGLDLSCLRVLGCGAEPIHAPTLRRFAAAYQPAGLAAEAFTPSYGLAEATLAVSFARGLRDRDGTVDCGQTVPGHEVAILDGNFDRCPEDRIGEVAVRGASVTAGYLTAEGVQSGPERVGGWLRTGDLGYLHGGALFVTGRRKDVIIVRGANIDPQRVEWAAASVPGVREAGVVACSRPGPDGEEVVVVVECGPGAPDGLAEAVRHAVVEPFGIGVADVVRVRPGTIPKTTSGKPRRQETRRRYLAGELTG